MDFGLILAGLGIFLMAGGILQFSKQNRKKEEELIEAVEIDRKLLEAKLVKRDMEELLKVATLQSEEIVTKIQREVEQAKTNLAHQEHNKLPVEKEVVNKKVEVVSSVPQKVASRPYYIEEYRQQLEGKNYSKSKNSPQSLYQQGEEYIRLLDKGTPQNWSKNERYEQIPVLRQMGIQDREIAQLLHIGLGELQLISELRRRA
ncbi:hypothetical protein F9B85_01400 [Heliorestis acidaminivorans]|uniref:DUF2802 domain-containing protein n=1 Tax=Heliorestis acidaminivorans TaxID=553427 RepID=A0A6I0F5X6_9FIRM|nr:hypothetical protein [Heliorestis acidaminivorans]KAB2954372.1 hypothetical protein F9B85_01400 [Heliorestis acidaminivorans]